MPDKKKNTLLLVLLVFCCCQIIFLTFQNFRLKNQITTLIEDRRSIQPGDIFFLPDFLYPLSINGVQSKTITQQKFNIYLFLSTNCPACEKDIEIWKKIYRWQEKYNYKFQVFSFDKPDDILRYIRFNVIPFNVYVDNKDSKVFMKNRIKSVPTLVIADNNNLVEYVWQTSISGELESEVIEKIFR